MAFSLKVNGTSYSVEADPQTPLLWVIRDQIGLTGTRFSCGIGENQRPSCLPRPRRAIIVTPGSTWIRC